MAFRPSLRRSRVQENTGPNMTPIMNLMVVLIPLLLSSAQLIKISIIELNLPPAAGARQQLDKPKEKKLKLDLAVTITDEGFYISSSAAVFKKKKKGPSIPKVNGQYDYELLAQILYKIKRKAQDKFKDANSIIIQAEPQVDYQTLVSTMDASRSIKLAHERVLLFPDVSVSALIL